MALHHKGNKVGIDLPAGTAPEDVARVIREESAKLEGEERALVDAALSAAIPLSRDGDTIYFAVGGKAPAETHESERPLAKHR